jgi:hypothetical protein
MAPARIRNAGRAWSREDIANVHACRLRGASLAEIAWLLCRPETEVQEKLDEIEETAGKSQLRSVSRLPKT